MSNIYDIRFIHNKKTSFQLNPITTVRVTKDNFLKGLKDYDCVSDINLLHDIFGVLWVTYFA